MKDYKALLLKTKFPYLWTSQILSQLTINIMNFLLLIRLFAATESTIATSLLWVSYALPAILIGPFAAASVDMVERRKMLMITNLSQALVIFLYTFIHHIGIFLLYGIVVVYSFLNQFYIPAEAASLPSLVKKQVYPQANGLFFLTQQIAVVLGFGIAGLLNGTLGFMGSLYLCSFMLFLAFLSVSFLPDIKVEQKIPKSFEKAVFKFFERIYEGYKFIKERHIVLTPFILLMAVQISLAIIMVNVPLLATDIFKISVEAAGFFIVAPAGLGAGIGAFIIPKLLKNQWRKKKIVEMSLMIITACFFVLVFIVPETSSILRMFIGILTVIFAGLSFIGILIPSQTLLQEKTPGGLRGRVFGNFWFLSTVATVFPVIFSGAIAELFGVKLLLVLLSGVSFSALVFSKKLGQRVLENGFSINNNA
jgi:DHA3 family macrolide efflux protein-like MFS transporter